MTIGIKKRALLLEIAVVGILLILPPIFFPSSIHLQPPSGGFYQTLLFILAVNLLVIYEELLYRVWFPDRLSILIPNRKFVTEIVPVLLFGLAHRGVGWHAVAFAFAAGGIFRFLYIITGKKFKDVVAFIVITAIHALWNWTLYVWKFYQIF